MKPADGKGSGNQPMRRFQQELNDVFQSFMNDALLSTPSLWEKETAFRPACNITEDKDRYILEVEIPGVHRDDIEIEVIDNSITIKGERRQKTVTEGEKGRVRMSEHTYGSFYRSLTLPGNIDAENIKATSKNGILTLEIPKQYERKTLRLRLERP